MNQAYKINFTHTFGYIQSTDPLEQNESGLSPLTLLTRIFEDNRVYIQIKKMKHTFSHTTNNTWKCGRATLEHRSVVRKLIRYFTDQTYRVND